MDHLRQRRRVLRLARVFTIVGVAALIVLSFGRSSLAHQADSTPDTATAGIGPDTSVHYVGVVEGTGIYVAVIDHGDGFVTAYLCDGVEVSVWFEPESAEGNDSGAFLLAAANGAAVSGTIADGIATGTATLANGTEYAFTAEEADQPAGLYARVTVEDDEVIQVRTIVLPNGTAKGKGSTLSCRAQRERWEFWRSVVAESNSAYEITQAIKVSDAIYAWAESTGCTWVGGSVQT